MKIKFLLILIVLLASCQTNETKQEYGYHEFFTKLLGKWQLENSKKIEHWKNDGDTFVGIASSPAGKRSFVTEKIRIRKIDGEIFYEVTVRGQNQEEPVLFKLTEVGKDQVVFENGTHDFPQKITYIFVSDDRFTATIQGIVKGKTEKMEFRYNRIKPVEADELK